MCSECDSVDEMAPLQRAVETMQARHSTAMPVTQYGRIVGLLTMDKISDRIMINAALEHNSTISRSGDRSHSYLNGSLSSGFSDTKQPIQPS
jgi:CBS domain containing-hemolysin-like protein